VPGADLQPWLSTFGFSVCVLGFCFVSFSFLFPVGFADLVCAELCGFFLLNTLAEHLQFGVKKKKLVAVTVTEAPCRHHHW
jgi:hypothetical protein